MADLCFDFKNQVRNNSYIKHLRKVWAKIKREKVLKPKMEAQHPGACSQTPRAGGRLGTVSHATRCPGQCHSLGALGEGGAEAGSPKDLGRGCRSEHRKRV